MSANNSTLPDATGTPKKQASSAASTPKKKASSKSSTKSPKPSTVRKSKTEDSGALSEEFSRLSVSDAKSSLSQLMERENTPSAEEVTVSTAQREKAVATKKYLIKKYAERRKTMELSQLRRNAFEVGGGCVGLAITMNRADPNAVLLLYLV